MAFRKCFGFEDAMFDIDFQRRQVDYSENYCARIDPFVCEGPKGENLLVVGFESSFIRMNVNRSTGLDNRPIALVIQQFTPKGKIRKGYWLWYLEFAPERHPSMPGSVRNEFWKRYEAHPAKSLRKIHQDHLALMAAEEYHGRGWGMANIPDVVVRSLQDTEFFRMVDLKNQALADRRIEARAGIAKAYGAMSQGSWLDSMFDVATKPRPATMGNCRVELRELNTKIERLKNKIIHAHRHEDMHPEAMEMRKATLEFNSLLKANPNEIPRDAGTGFIDWISLLSEK